MSGREDRQQANAPLADRASEPKGDRVSRPWGLQWRSSIWFITLGVSKSSGPHAMIDSPKHHSCWNRHVQAPSALS